MDAHFDTPKIITVDSAQANETIRQMAMLETEF